MNWREPPVLLVRRRPSKSSCSRFLARRLGSIYSARLEAAWECCELSGLVSNRADMFQTERGMFFSERDMF